MQQFKKVLEVSHVPSVNDMYLHGKGGRRYLNKDYVKTKENIIKQLTESNIKQFFTGFYEDQHKVKLSLAFVYNKRYNVRDASNSIKLIEDAISKASGVDDKFNYSVTATKLMGDSLDKTERVYVVLSYQYAEDLDITEDEFLSNQWVGVEV